MPSDQPFTQADVQALAAVLSDTFLDRSLDCWPDFVPEARAALKHIAARFVAEGRRQALSAAAACTTCGNIHTWRWHDPDNQARGGTWGHPDDGHAYSPLLQRHQVEALRSRLAEQMGEIVD